MIEVKDVEKKALSFPDRAREIKISDNATFIAAGEFLKSIKALRGEIDDTFSPITKKAYEAWKETLRQRERVEAPLVEAEGIVKPAIAAYITEQERIRREEELRLQKLAQDDAERQMVADAALLDDIGETELANALLEQAPVVAPIIQPRTAPKVAGIALTKRYSAQVINFQQLVKAVAEGKVPFMAIQANTTFLNQQARAMKEQLNYPGVKLVVEGNVSAGKR